MAHVQTDAYIDGLLRSNLVARDAVKPHWLQLQKELNLKQVPGAKLGERLVAAGLLTQWQHEQLVEGRPQGFLIGNYKLIGHLGSGGMGDVYLAEHVKMHRQVALKVLPQALVDSPFHLQRFYQESRATAALSHPNIVQAFDVDHDAATGDHFMAMEYIEGQDLQRVVAQQGRLRSHQAADYIRQAALGLNHAHDRGMIHRDIKPGNLLVDGEGRVKVLDMGIARILEQEDEHSLTLACKDQLMGTIDYIAPEQLQNPHLVDGRADVYALGCTLFFLLAGHPPFHTGTLAQRLMKHQIQPPPDLRALRPDVPPDLVKLCERMLLKKPADRFQTAGEVAAALQDWLERDDPSLDGPPLKDIKRRKIVADHTINEKGFAAEKLLADLLAQRVLTSLQAEIISGQRREPLTVHGYQLLEQIPEGRLKGMYRGRHGTLHFPVCLKLLWLSAEEQERERQLVQFQHEARVASQLQHPNVVKTYEVGREGDLCYATLENLVGQTMADYLTPLKRPTLSEACRMVREAALGLAHLHEMDVVHRNICPQNLWVSDDGAVKVMDFTLARDSLHYLNSEPIETVIASKDEVFGAADYVAPEQAIDSQDVSPQSDIYGLGCTLYHALTGRAPFASTNTTKLMLKHAHQTPERPSSFNPRVSEELDEFVLLMMAKSPTSRVRSAALVAQVLEMFV